AINAWLQMSSITYFKPRKIEFVLVSKNTWHSWTTNDWRLMKEIMIIANIAKCKDKAKPIWEQICDKDSKQRKGLSKKKKNIDHNQKDEEGFDII
ncbi:hypothetical protein HAX54_035654, partial [Datura stramonium]|nr:hypothetical protein [Datura stramonium]